MLAGVSRSSYWLCCAFPSATAHLNPPTDLNYKKQEVVTAENVTLLKIPKFFASYSSKSRRTRFVLVKIQTSGMPTCARSEITTSWRMRRWFSEQSYEHPHGLSGWWLIEYNSVSATARLLYF